jgi:two-component system, OmpR family, sensor histidine kinase KdpD
VTDGNGSARPSATRLSELRRVPSTIGRAAGYLVGTLGVALVTLAIAQLGVAQLANASMLYLIVVLVAAVAFGRGPAIFSAVLAFFTFNYFFTEPRHTLLVADPDDWIPLLLFLLTAVVTGQLAAGQRRRAEEAEEHERQARLLYDISAALTEPTLEGTLETVASRLRDELGVDVVQIEVRATSGRPKAISGDDEMAMRALERADHSVEILIPEAAGGGRSERASRWMRISPPHRPLAGVRPPHRVARASIRSPAGEEVGSITLVDRTDARFDDRAARLLAAVTPQLWAALERVRLRHEATEAEVLRRSDEAKSALLDAVSHDLRTPLASITAAAGSLRQTDVAWSEDERVEFAAAIEQEAARLNRIVGNLLDLSRIRAGTLHPDLAWYEPVALVRDVLLRLAPVTASHDLRTELPEELPPVAMDYSEVDQVLTNLVENAVRHSPPGSAITVAAEIADGSLAIRVDDSGPGIEPGALERVFEPFYRAGPAGRPGTGLGLAVARGLVDAHGGTIWAERRREGGTRFAFTIPLGEDSP